MRETDYHMENSNFVGCAIGDRATVVHPMQFDTPSETEYEQIIIELENLKKSLRIGSTDRKGINKIINHVSKRDWSAVRSATCEFLSQFSSATLAKLTGSCLGHLLGL